MKSKLPLFLLLSFVGLLVGEQLPSLITPFRVVKETQVGENLVGAHCSPGGKFVVGFQRTSNGDWFVCTYHTDGKPVLEPVPVQGPTGLINRITWKEDGTGCAVSNGAEVLVFEFGRQPKVHKLGAVWQARELRFCGDWLMARCDNTLLIWDKQLQPAWRVGLERLLHADLAENGRHLLLGAFERGCFLVDLDRQKVVHRFDPQMTPAYLRFNNNDTQITTAFRIRGDRRRDHVVSYQTESGRQIGERLQVAELFTCHISDDGTRLLTNSQIGPAVWNPITGDLISQPEIERARVNALSPDGKLALSAPGQKKSLDLWNTEDGKLVKRFSLGKAASWIQFASNTRFTITESGHASVWNDR